MSTTCERPGCLNAEHHDLSDGDFPRERKGFRHLGRLSTPRPGDVCEMGDEDDCTETPAFWLTAPASYVMPMLMCASHAKAENFYFGTPMPEAK